MSSVAMHQLLFTPLSRNLGNVAARGPVLGVGGLVFVLGSSVLTPAVCQYCPVAAMSKTLTLHALRTAGFSVCLLTEHTLNSRFKCGQREACISCGVLAQACGARLSVHMPQPPIFFALLHIFAPDSWVRLGDLFKRCAACTGQVQQRFQLVDNCSFASRS